MSPAGRNVYSMHRDYCLFFRRLVFGLLNLSLVNQSTNHYRNVITDIYQYIFEDIRTNFVKRHIGLSNDYKSVTQAVWQISQAPNKVHYRRNTFDFNLYTVSYSHLMFLRWRSMNMNKASTIDDSYRPVISRPLCSTLNANLL